MSAGGVNHEHRRSALGDLAVVAEQRQEFRRGIVADEPPAGGFVDGRFVGQARHGKVKNVDVGAGADAFDRVIRLWVAGVEVRGGGARKVAASGKACTCDLKTTQWRNRSE